jgi:hypothetical protein
MIIFDLDGTLADCEHRRHFVEPTGAKKWVDEEKYFGPEFKGQCGYHWFNKDETIWDGKKDWQAFYEACDKDEPIVPTIQCFNYFFDDLGSENVQIWSGRCESVRDKTIDWLYRNIPSFSKSLILQMRPIGDSTPDDVLKERWLDDLTSGFNDITGVYDKPHNINFVFDNRPKVIRMWRRRGIFVFNCCQHDKEF